MEAELFAQLLSYIDNSPIITSTVVIIVALLVIANVIVKFTKTTKDDVVLNKIISILEKFSIFKRELEKSGLKSSKDK